MVEGELLIRDAEEALALETPTTLSGTYDSGDGGTGAMSGVTFDTPVVSFQTVAQGFDVFVDATFSQVTPASGSGAIDSDGNVVVQTALQATLDIEVGTPPLIVNRCVTTPVNVTLDSVVPYDTATGTVTLSDSDFTIPAVPVTPNCIQVVADGVNGLIAGAGHSLTLSMEGELTPPAAPGCPSTTALAVAPATSTLGAAVNLTATVAIDPTAATDPLCDDAEGVTPAGFVEFREGNRVLGTGELNGSGVATLSTSDLPAGTRNLSARYRGQDPYSASSSEVVSHRVSAPPAIVAGIPENIQIGGAPVEFDVTVTNTGFGSEVTNARLDLALRRITGGGNGIGPTNLTVEYWNGTTWVTSTLTGGTEVWTAISPSTGAPLLAGQSFTRRVRLTVKPAANPVILNAVFNLVRVDPVTGLPAAALAPAPANLVGQTTVRTHLVKVPRVTTTLSADALLPHTVRQGQTMRVHNISTDPSTVGSLRPSGTYEVLLDGVPIPVRTDSTVPELGYQPTVPAGVGLQNAEFVVPVDGATGTRTVTVRYSGDRFFTPSQWTGTFTVLASRGATYVCKEVTPFFTDRFTVNVEANASLPSVVAPGQEVDLGHLDINLYSDRANAVELFGGNFPADNPVLPPGSTADGVRSLAFGFGGDGSGTAAAVTFANNTVMDDSTLPVDPAPDQVIGFTGESGSITIEGAPGDVVPVVFASVHMEAFLGIDFGVECEPLGDPLVLGRVTVAGTALAVDAPSPTRAGDVVTLVASVAPVGASGTVEFRDGTTTIGVTRAGTDGTASITIDSLAVGAHSLTARFFGGTAGLSTTSEAVPLSVLVAVECAAFAEEGNGAVVRLVYMELLGRCPDQAGFDFWVGRLDGGTSSEVFARTIARTPEAVGRVVDDAYETMLGRSADASGRAFWVDRMLTGSGRYDALLADLGASEEFWTLSGSDNTGFVTRVYEQLLNRAPEQSGQDYWVGRLDAGTSRRALIVSLANQDEPLGVLVTDSYDEILSRKPTASELSDGITFLRRTGDRSGLYAQLIGRPEFATRAGTFPNPED